ncbi:MAG: hypothetical protein MUE40_13780 [Anaerolineae bacterium]|jgi:predicted transcriptional regulator|nr:hypothetical protein [Anaerolineae bacterium]
MPSHSHRTHEETRQAILALFTPETAWLTRTEIAQRLARKKSPYLIEVIEELAAAGLLQRETFSYHNGVQGYMYARPGTPL